MNKLISVICTVCCLLSAVSLPARAQEPAAAPAAPKTAASTPAGTEKSINTAIGDLNYKVEFMQQRYFQLNRDVEALQKISRDQQKSITDLSASGLTPEQISYLESELSLLRAELAQVREQISTMKSVPGIAPESAAAAADEPKIQTLGRKVLHSPWLSVAAIVLSLAALAIR